MEKLQRRRPRARVRGQSCIPSTGEPCFSFEKEKHQKKVELGNGRALPGMCDCCAILRSFLYSARTGTLNRRTPLVLNQGIVALGNWTTKTAIFR